MSSSGSSTRERNSRRNLLSSNCDSKTASSWSANGRGDVLGAAAAIKFQKNPPCHLEYGFKAIALAERAREFELDAFRSCASITDIHPFCAGERMSLRVRCDPFGVQRSGKLFD